MPPAIQRERQNVIIKKKKPNKLILCYVSAIVDYFCPFSNRDTGLLLSSAVLLVRSYFRPETHVSELGVHGNLIILVS